MENSLWFRQSLSKLLKEQAQNLSVAHQNQIDTLEKIATLLENGNYEEIANLNGNPISGPPQNKHLNLYDYYAMTNREDILISYKGPVTDIIMAEISRDIRDKFAESPKISKKLFAVFIELAQNILYYSSEKILFGNRQDSVGTLLIYRTLDQLMFSCGNLVENQYIDTLIQSCDKINSLNRDELRAFKRETRSAPQGERSKGAGIGLIQVALTSGNPLKVESQPVDPNYSFFSLTVQINK